MSMLLSIAVHYNCTENKRNDSPNPKPKTEKKNLNKENTQNNELQNLEHNLTESIQGKWITEINDTTYHIEFNGNNISFDEEIKYAYTGTYTIKDDKLIINFTYESPIGPQAVAPHDINMNVTWHIKLENDNLYITRPIHDYNRNTESKQTLAFKKNIELK